MENQKNTDSQPPKKRGFVQSVIVGALGVVSAIYIINPGAGLIELIPDNIPGIGNLDEAAAAAMLISCLAYFGFDAGRLFGGGKRKKKSEDNGEPPTIEAEVVED